MDNPKYQLPQFESAINHIIGFIFYYRLAFVISFTICAAFVARYIFVHSTTSHQAQNIAFVLTGASIMIGIFYSIINYEHNLSKFKYDKKSLKESLTFNTSFKMCDPEMVKHSKNVKKFYDENKTLFKENRCTEIESLFDQNPEKRLSWVVMMNYLETVSIGIEQKLIDEVFIKEFFKTIFLNYRYRFGSYIEYGKETKGPRVFKAFIKVSARWANEN